jgi:hypothetical protein
LRLPYQVYDSQYSVEPFTLLFNPMPWVKKPPQPAYHHALIREFYTGIVLTQYQEARSHVFEAFLGKVSAINDFFFGFWPVLIFPMIWPYPLESRDERIAVVLLVICVLSLAPLTFQLPHYEAFMTGLLYLRFMQTMVRLNVKPLGRAFAAFFIALFVCQFAEWMVSIRTGVGTSKFVAARQAVTQELEKQKGNRDLVLVRYKPDHTVGEEWVFNRADIDGSEIVWAREMGAAEDAPMLAYFHDRRAWLLEPDETPWKLTPITPTMSGK